MGTQDQWFAFQAVFEAACDKNLDDLEDKLNTLARIMRSRDPREEVVAFERRQQERMELRQVLAKCA